MAVPRPTSGTPPLTPLRVLFVQGHLRENGGLRVVLELARRFVADGVPTTVFALEDAHDAATARPDPSVHLVLGAPATASLLRRVPQGLASLVRQARTHDVVVSGSEIGHGLLSGWLAARLTRTPFVVLAQGDLDAALLAWVPAHLRRATRFAVRHADAAVCVSPGLRDGVVRNGLPVERTHVVVNGIDVEDFRRRGAAGGPRPPHAVPHVVAVGRLTVHKGFDLLVRASCAVRARGLDHELTIAGEGAEREALEGLVAELGADHVTLSGFCPDPAPLLADADLFVCSSRTEAMPLTLLEALALAVPVVATDCCLGSRMLLDADEQGRGRLGRLVPVESVEALAEALEDHLRDPGRLRGAAVEGPAFARGFDPRRLAREHLAVLAGVTGRTLPERLRPLPAGGQPDDGPSSAGTTRRALPA